MDTRSALYRRARQVGWATPWKTSTKANLADFLRPYEAGNRHIGAAAVHAAAAAERDLVLPANWYAVPAWPSPPPPGAHLFLYDSNDAFQAERPEELAERLRPVIGGLAEGVRHTATVRAVLGTDVRVEGRPRYTRLRLIQRDLTSAKMNRGKTRSNKVTTRTHPVTFAYLLVAYIQSLLDSNADELYKIEIIFTPEEAPREGEVPGPMREGAKNCFVRCVVGAFQGRELTARQRAHLEKLDASGGVHFSELAKTETVFRMGIRIVSALDSSAVLRAPTKYADSKHKALTVLYSANHATALPPTFPQLRAVHLCGGLATAPQEPGPAELAWLAAALDAWDDPDKPIPPSPYEEVAPAALVDFGDVVRAKLAAGLACWQLGDDVAVAGDGTLIRPAAEAARTAAELARLGLRPDPLAITSRSAAFKHFRDANDLISCGARLGAVIGSCAVEFVSWTSSELCPPNLCEVDVARAFASCVLGEDAPSRVAARRWGFPTGRRFYAQAINGVPPAELPTGWATIARWKLADDVPPAIAGMLAHHLAKPSPSIATPLLAFLMAKNVFAEIRVRELVHALDVSPDLSFAPFAADKVACNDVIGCLEKNATRSTRITSDGAEARALSAHFNGAGRACSVEERAGLFFIEYETEGKRATYQQLRSYILAYAALLTFSKLYEARDKGIKVYEVVADALFVADEDAARLADAGTAPGCFRVKGHRNARGYKPADLPREGTPQPSPPTSPEGHPEALRYGAAFWSGPAGAGKTTTLLNELRNSVGLKNVVLYTAFTNYLTHEKKEDDLQVATVHSAFAVGADGRINEQRDRRWSPVVVVDEVGQLPPLLVDDIRRDCRRRGIILIFAGDLNQLAPVNSERPGAALEGLPVVHCDGDLRSRCDALKALKKELCGLPAADALALLRERIPRVTMAELYEQYQPGDYVLTASKCRALNVGRRLLHSREWPAGVPYVMTAGGFGGMRDVVAPDGKTIRACAGTVVHVPYADDLKAEYPSWRLGVCRTTHSLQGTTIDQKIYVLDGHELAADFFSGGLYVIFSRARRLEQYTLVR